MGYEIPLKVVVLEMAQSFQTTAVVSVKNMDVMVVSRINEIEGTYFLVFEAFLEGKTVAVSQNMGDGEEGLRKSHRALRDGILLRNGAMALVESALDVEYGEPDEEGKSDG